MRFIIQVVAIALSAALVQSFFPWWTLAVTAFACGFLLRSDYNFLAGFLGIFLLWGITAFVIHSQAVTPLATQVATIFSLQQVWLLIVVTSMLGGLVGGMASLTGSLLRQKHKKRYY